MGLGMKSGDVVYAHAFGLGLVQQESTIVITSIERRRKMERSQRTSGSMQLSPLELGGEQ